jgi:hypothetical protein
MTSVMMKGPSQGAESLCMPSVFLDTPKDEVANVEGSFPNIAIVVASELLVVMSLSHNGGESLFFEAVKVDATCLLGLSFLVVLDAWSSEGDVGRYYNF